MTAPVYRGYSQEALDAQYRSRLTAPDFESWFRNWQSRSSAAREVIRGILDIPYGYDPLQKIDVFPAPAAGAPLEVFIHGGFWRSQDKSSFSFPAPTLHMEGIGFVAVNYPLCPHVTLAEIVSSIHLAIGFCIANASRWNCDASRIHVSGHSAGAHLAAMLLTDTSLASNLRGILGISGVYDLEPIRLTAMNTDIRLLADDVVRLSPARLRPGKNVPVTLSVGELESAEFRRQQADLVSAWSQAELSDLTVIPAPDDHHFSILDDYASKDGRLHAMIRRRVFT
jgi:arylformamidase